ncbi:radical SAM family heme chaperone HemW [Thiohalocapsa marina]|uniref:Heme chaperone HemW n=1 Tax=Thiohalocapsa marina TaxID=424902 RepID=A0A5M8FND5_9GAMM|nr:radical SAM family heme chaperone HemW [Thiohalocapsa marina]KAA6185510.1 radical SAM family heme chaperone HemW [Thiohalocapsa marina]
MSARVRHFVDGAPPLALYVHVPWCVRKCPYCDFNSHALRTDIPEARYIDALLADLDGQLDAQRDAQRDAPSAGAAANRPLVSIFIGGGTPSLLSGAAVQRLLHGIRQRCALADDAEITLEANPGAIDAGHFEGYVRAGVNRLSIGVQSLHAAHLARLGRIHTPAQALAAVKTARAAGIDNLNLDLMFALPTQTLAQAREDLQRLLALEPEHVSYYQLTLEPNTAFARQPPALPDHELACDMQEQGLERLAQAGFRRYEVSAFSRPGRRCRHNLNYWRFGDYLGIGAGAHGKLSDPSSGRVERRTRPRHPNAYLDALAPSMPSLSGRPSTGQPTACLTCSPTASRPLDDADLILEFALNALRLTDGVEAAVFQRHTGLRPERLDAILQQARRDGLLQPDDARIAPTELGQRFLNDLICRFTV